MAISVLPTPAIPFKQHDGLILKGAFQLQHHAIPADEAVSRRLGAVDLCPGLCLLVFQ